MNRPHFKIVAYGDRFRLWSKPAPTRMWVVSHPGDLSEMARLLDRTLDLYRRAGAR